MKVLIDNVLKQQGKTRNWLSEETGITYANICKLCNGKTKSIQFDIADKICSVLDCKISDILSHEKIEINRLIAYYNKVNKLNEKDDRE